MAWQKRDSIKFQHINPNKFSKAILTQDLDQRQVNFRNVTQFTTDGFDRPDKTIYPNSSFEQVTLYDANSNPLKIRNRAAQILNNTFDTLNRLKTRTPAGLSTQTMAYDLAGRLLQVSTPVVAGEPGSGDHAFFFDTAGRLIQERTPDGKNVTYGLDENGNTSRLTYPDGFFVDYVLDALDRLTDIKLNGAATAAAHFDLDKLSRRTKLTLDNGCVTDYGYEVDDDLSTLVHSFVGSAVTFAHTFDNTNKLKTQSVSDAQFMWHPSLPGVSVYGPANNLNQYPLVSGVPQTYNTNGCLTGDGVRQYGYDSLNRMVTANLLLGTTLWRYRYDPMDRLVQKEVAPNKTRFVYAGWQRVADYDGTTGALQNRYVYGIGLDEPIIEVSAAGTLTYMHQDRIGSVIARSNAAGNVTNRYKYSPFGESPSVAGTTFGFQSQRFDPETGLYFFKARHYNPRTGRFQQPDPIGMFDSLNLYEFVGNDPLNATDPLGLQASSVRLITGIEHREGYPYTPGWAPEATGRFKKGSDDPDQKKKCKDDRKTDQTPFTFPEAATDLFGEAAVPPAQPAMPGATPTPPGLGPAPLHQTLLRITVDSVIMEVLGAVFGASIGAAARRFNSPPSQPKLYSEGGPRVQGPFSIRDWTGYPTEGNVPRPSEPVSLPSKDRYLDSRAQADEFNAGVMKPSGYEIHEILPVRLGGHPTSVDNKVALPKAVHDLYTNWWTRGKNSILRWAQGTEKP